MWATWALCAVVAAPAFAGPRDLRLVAGGDVAYPRDGGIDRVVARYHDELFDDIKPFIQGADLAFLNLETPLTNRDATGNKRWPLVTRPDRLQWLIDAGFNLYSLANNHTHDAGDRGVHDTLEAFEGARAAGHTIWWAGAARDKAGAWSLTTFTPPGKSIVVAFVALGEARTGLVPPPKDPRALDLIRRADQQADVVIVSVHSGREYEHVPRAHRAERFRGYVDAGADLVLGHHPHVVQGVERYKDAVIFHSLGNLSFGSRSIRHLYAGAKLYGILPIIDIQDGKVAHVEIVPLYVNNVEPWKIGKEVVETRPCVPKVVKGVFAQKVLSALLEWTAQIPGIDPEAVGALSINGERAVMGRPVEAVSERALGPVDCVPRRGGASQAWWGCWQWPGMAIHNGF